MDRNIVYIITARSPFAMALVWFIGILQMRPLCSEYLSLKNNNNEVVNLFISFRDRLYYFFVRKKEHTLHDLHGNYAF